jgi:arabinogalactan oligomer/maltooligosaccharide transport system permease protein
VLFPILWIFSLALDPRNLSRPDSLIPPGASLDAFARVIAQPTSDEIGLLELARNSFLLASSVALFSVGIGVLAAYAFSRLRFRGREVLMITILGVLMLPAVATIAPLFIMLNGIRLDLPILGHFALRQSLIGVGLAVVSGTLPFAIWNLKGYLDTIPKELEEAAAVDGCSRNQSFFKIVLPLATPALAVTGFLGFVAGWTEFYFVSIFLNDPSQGFTLSLALNKMVGAFGQTPWSDFAAFSILFAAPVSIVFFFFQKYIVGGLAVGGVKG